MHFKTKIWGAAVVGALGLATGLGVTLASAGAPAAKILPLVSKQTSFQEVDVGKVGPSAGDLVIFTDDFTLKNGRKQGTDVVVCTATSTTFSQCQATAFLPSGSIMSQGATPSPPPAKFQVSILGGTGAYKGTCGQYTVQAVSQTVSNETFELLPCR